MCHTTRDDDDDDDAFLQNAETHTRRNANALCWVREREKELYNIIFFTTSFLRDWLRIANVFHRASSSLLFERVSSLLLLIKRLNWGRRETAKGTTLKASLSRDDDDDEEGGNNTARTRTHVFLSPLLRRVVSSSSFTSSSSTRAKQTPTMWFFALTFLPWPFLCCYSGK